MAYELRRLASKLAVNIPFMRLHDQALGALIRLDERVRRSSPELASGFKSRCDFYEAQAVARVVHLEDVVLHDANTDVRIPTDEILAASRALVRRRELAKASKAKCADPEYLAKITDLPLTDFLATESVASLATQSPGSNVLDELAQDDLTSDTPTKDDLAAAMGDLDSLNVKLTIKAANPASGSIAELLHEIAPLPPFLGGILLLDHWFYQAGETISDSGPLLLGAHWKASGLMTAHSPSIARGLWKSRNRWQRQVETEERITSLLAAFTELAKLGHADLDRLTLAGEVMLNKVPSRGRHIKLLEMIAVFVELPVVSNAILIKPLKISKQAVDYLLAQLGSALPRELTGRERYRAWGVL